MTIIYDVILKTAKGGVCIFYDEERGKALKAMQDYVKKNGFTWDDRGNRFTISTVVLRERESTGKVISEKMYHELFDTISGKLLATEN